MVARPSRVIVNTGSCSAFTPEAGHTAYSASKAGLLALTRSLARELGEAGTRVMAVVPGWIAVKRACHVTVDVGRE